MHYQINIGGRNFPLDLTKETGRENRWLAKLHGREIALDVLHVSENALSIVMEGQSFQARTENSSDENGTRRIVVGGKTYEVILRDAKSLRSRNQTAGADAGPLKVKASMPGRVVRVLANKGDSVQAGSGIVVVEAMKMQNEVRSPKDGTVKELLACEGMNVNAGDVLAVLE